MFEGINKDDKDFTALVSKLKSANPDLVYWGGLHDTAGLIVRQMRDQGVKAPLMGGDGIADDEFAAIAGPGAEGTLMTFSPDPRTNPKPTPRSLNYSARSAVRAPGLHALQLRLGADHQAGGGDCEIARPEEDRGRDALRHIFSTVLGDVSFDKKGDISAAGYVVDGKKKDRYVLYIWKKGPDGRITYIEDK